MTSPHKGLCRPHGHHRQKLTNSQACPMFLHQSNETAYVFNSAGELCVQHLHHCSHLADTLLVLVTQFSVTKLDILCVLHVIGCRIVANMISRVNFCNVCAVRFLQARPKRSPPPGSYDSRAALLWLSLLAPLSELAKHRDTSLSPGLLEGQCRSL